MNSVFTKVSYITVLALLLMFSTNAVAQSNLAPNPWAKQQAPNPKNYQPQAKTMNGLPANPWQGSGNAVTGQNTGYTASGTKNVPTPVYTGQSTTWNTAMGQESIAPEVNVHNMLSMTNHLRALGYQIPPSFDEFIRTAPAKTKARIMKALYEVQKGGDDPLSKGLAQVIKDGEKSSGFSVENLLGNSLDLLSK